jgi:hypothetical protein
MSETRAKFTAEYSYPGSFFAESATREIADGRYESAVEAQLNNSWFAVKITKSTERRFTAANGDERWLREREPEKVGSWVVGDRVHWTAIPDTDENRILRSNIRSNSEDGYGVLTRRGNWQIASDFTGVVAR